jgi:dCMP deaminase
MLKKKKRFHQKVNVFSEIVRQIADLSVASRLKVGAIAVRKDFSKIASFGYNGSYFNAPINQETGTEEESLTPGESGMIHAEINLIAKFRENDPENYAIIITHSPCKMCTKVLVNAGFKNIYWLDEYRDTSHLGEIFERTDVVGCNVKDLNDSFESC